MIGIRENKVDFSHCVCTLYKILIFRNLVIIKYRQIFEISSFKSASNEPNTNNSNV
jgi:hypothetical protein